MPLYGWIYGETKGWEKSRFNKSKPKMTNGTTNPSQPYLTMKYRYKIKTSP